MASSITRVLICDDSAVARESLARLLESDPAIRVVARSGNGRAALDAITRQPVDVVVLDIEMPIMDGITALPMLVRAAPGVRVIMAPRTAQKGANLALRALRDGAADFIAKPGTGDFGGMAGFRTELLAKVKGHGRI
ncbi:MAG: response regulator, partial [Pseudomonadota bacterium]|nr:response regulator [Pseudomonadota bacterium]